MYVLNTKLLYSILVSMVTIMAFIWIITPMVKELGYQTASYAIKPLWFLGKSRDPSGEGIWNRMRFYNYRRSYIGGHRGVKW